MSFFLILAFIFIVLELICLNWLRQKRNSTIQRIADPDEKFIFHLQSSIWDDLVIGAFGGLLSFLQQISIEDRAIAVIGFFAAIMIKLYKIIGDEERFLEHKRKTNNERKKKDDDDFENDESPLLKNSE